MFLKHMILSTFKLDSNIKCSKSKCLTIDLIVFEFLAASEAPFRYRHHQNVWIYMKTNESKSDIKKQFIIVLITNDFNPEKYDSLSKYLAKSYQRNGDVNKLLSIYLSLIINGSCSTEQNGSFQYNSFNQLEIMASKSPIKSIIKMFGLDVILIFTGLLLKKRIAVYHHKCDTLLQFIIALPAFVWHRHNWDQILYPCIELSSQQEVDELKSLNHYVAGFLESQVENRTDLYDVYVNLAAVEITVAHSAKDTFCMTKTHKDIAVFMSRQAESESTSDMDVIKELMGKTKELIKTLKSLGSSSETQANDETRKTVITLDKIKERKLAPALENFLWNLTLAEDLN